MAPDGPAARVSQVTDFFARFLTKHLLFFLAQPVKWVVGSVDGYNYMVVKSRSAQPPGDDLITIASR